MYEKNENVMMSFMQPVKTFEHVVLGQLIFSFSGRVLGQKFHLF